VKFHTVYDSFESVPGGRDYIGKHSTEDPQDEYKGSFKDGSFNPDNKIVFAYAKTPEGALWLEVMFQKVFGVVEDPQYANQSYQTSEKFTFDPTGRSHTEETKRKIGERSKVSMTGRSGPRSPRWGKTHSEDTKETIRQKATGRRHTKEAREKMQKPKKGRELQVGEKAPTYGLFWWVDENNHPVLSSVSPGEGWVRGRKWKR